MKLNVKLFARARDLAGADKVELELEEGARVADLRRGLAGRLPQLDHLVPHLLVAIDNRYADDSEQLAGGSEVACFPPVSGG